MKKTVLVVIDMQNDFISGSLGTPEAEKIVPAVVEKINTCSADLILATRDTHFESYLETLEGIKLPVPHCIRGTDGWKIHPRIAAALKDAILLDKYTFGSTRLPEEIRTALGTDDIEIELVGLCTDICVVSNAMILRAAFPDAHIRVDAACCAGVTPKLHEEALDVMQSCQIDIINR